MDDIHSRSQMALDHLDRGVTLFTIGGVIFNAFEASLAAIGLTALAATSYGLARNRIANMDEFEFITPPPAPPGINLPRLTWVCQWLGSRPLFEGLLGDFVDPEVSATPETARRHLREALWPAIWVRAKIKILALLWLDRAL